MSKLLEGSLVTWNVEPPVQGRVIEVTIDLDGDLWASLSFRGNDKDVKVLVEEDVLLLDGTPTDEMLWDGSLTTNVGKRFYGWDGATYRCIAHNDRGYLMEPEIITGSNPTPRSITERAIGGTFFEIAKDGRVKGLLGAPNCLESRPLSRENFQVACKVRKDNGVTA